VGLGIALQSTIESDASEHLAFKFTSHTWSMTDCRAPRVNLVLALQTGLLVPLAAPASATAWTGERQTFTGTLFEMHSASPARRVRLAGRMFFLPPPSISRVKDVKLKGKSPMLVAQISITTSSRHLDQQAGGHHSPWLQMGPSHPCNSGESPQDRCRS
jgi:hypothetical protein